MTYEAQFENVKKLVETELFMDSCDLQPDVLPPNRMKLQGRNPLGCWIKLDFGILLSSQPSAMDWAKVRYWLWNHCENEIDPPEITIGKADWKTIIDSDLPSFQQKMDNLLRAIDSNSKQFGAEVDIALKDPRMPDIRNELSKWHPSKAAIQAYFASGAQNHVEFFHFIKNLATSGLITHSGSNGATITAFGKAELENNNSNEPAQIERTEAITQTLNIGSINNSSFQVAGHGSSQKANSAIGVNQLQRAFAELDENIANLNLPDSDSRQIKAKVATLKALCSAPTSAKD